MILYDTFANPMLKCTARDKTSNIYHLNPDFLSLKIRVFKFYKLVLKCFQNIGEVLNTTGQRGGGDFSRIPYNTPISAPI